ncbi:MAG: hypothetical protein NT028_03165 [candidate division Zixibacteria bacterium]|nr:hypothetical protein [candidate division Zixibacteria bacterium]
MTRSIRWAALTILLVSATGTAKTQPAFQYPDLVRPKQPIALSSNAAHYIEKHQENGEVKVWVFFTDKGVYTKGQFESATLAARETLTPRALARRAKHGINTIEFADLPVNQHYVDLVVNAGGKLRWASRWLNAASFEVDQAALDLIGKFPFVERIKKQ